MINDIEDLGYDFEIDYDDIVTSVIKSLKCKAVDYCYTRKDMNTILEKAKEENLSMYYQEFLDRNGALDYFKIVPARFYTYNNDGAILLKGKCYKISDIPNELQCIISKNGHNHVFKAFNEPVKF